MVFCPHCQLPLQPVTCGGTEAWLCRGCGGCWADAATAAPLLCDAAALGDVYGRLATASDHPADATSPSIARYCPRCPATPLAPPESTDAPYTCPHCHGVWLERGACAQLIGRATDEGREAPTQRVSSAEVAIEGPSAQPEPSGAQDTSERNPDRGDRPAVILDASDAAASLDPGELAADDRVANSAAPDAETEDLRADEPEASQSPATELTVLLPAVPDSAISAPRVASIPDKSEPASLDIGTQGSVEQSPVPPWVTTAVSQPALSAATVEPPPVLSSGTGALVAASTGSARITSQPHVGEIAPSSAAIGLRRWCPQCREGYPLETLACLSCSARLVAGAYPVRCARCTGENAIAEERCRHCGAPMRRASRASYLPHPPPPMAGAKSAQPLPQRWAAGPHPAAARRAQGRSSVLAAYVIASALLLGLIAFLLTR